MFACNYFHLKNIPCQYMLYIHTFTCSIANQKFVEVSLSFVFSANKVFFIKPNSLTFGRHRGSHASFTEMHKLCNIIQDIITYFKLYIRYSVCLYKILQRPFNIPQAFSVTTQTEQSFLWKYFCCGYLVSSLSDFNGHKCRGNAESPIVTIGTVPAPTKQIFNFGMASPSSMISVLSKRKYGIRPRLLRKETRSSL